MLRRSSSLLVLVLFILPFAALHAAPAFASGPVLAQETTDEDEGAVDESDEAENPGSSGEEGQDADTESGAGEEETAPAEDEEGPVWTYQMSKIVIVLFVLLLLGIGGAYWNFVAKRQKEGI